MATKYDDQPFYRLNRFLENRLRGVNELNGLVNPEEVFIPPASEYETDLVNQPNFRLPFFMAAQQSSEILTIYQTDEGFKNLPFAVYSVMVPKKAGYVWSVAGQVTYNFYWSDIAGLFTISSFLDELLKREDWSADDVNYFFREDPTNPFDFKYVCSTTSAGPTPIEDEGGRSSYMVSVYYEATYEGPGRTDEYSYKNGPAGWGMR